MSSDRAGNSTFWTSVKKLVLGDTVTPDLLFTYCIDKVSDRTVWLLNQITSVRSDLAQTTAGTRATVVGSVDLSGLTYDPITGTLNNLQLPIQADAGGPITVTFGIGAGAPASPADVANAIATAGSSYFSATVDSAGHLNIYSLTTGSGSTIDIIAGSAVSALGFSAAQNATGVSSGNDGISRVGGASIVGSQGTIPSGTLRSMLTWIANRVPSGTGAVAEQSLITNFSTHGTVVPGNLQGGTPGDNFMQMLTKLQNGVSLTQVAFWFKPDSRASMPGTKPTFAVYRQPIAGGSPTVIGVAVTDPNTGTTGYDVAHAITCPITAGSGGGGTSETVDLTQYVYYGLFVSESGSNSDNLALLYGCLMTVTR